MLLLIFLIGSPAVSNATHLFPFLIRRYGANIDNWIHNLHTSIRELYNDFSLALEDAVSILAKCRFHFSVIPWRFLFGKLQPSTRVFRKREYLKVSANEENLSGFFLEGTHRLRLTLVRSCRLFLLQDVPALSQTEAPHPHKQACN
jgi:hypothetical protein